MLEAGKLLNGKGGEGDASSSINYIVLIFRS
jgi:hypothetical protein